MSSAGGHIAGQGDRTQLKGHLCLHPSAKAAALGKLVEQLKSVGVAADQIDGETTRCRSGLGGGPEVLGSRVDSLETAATEQSRQSLVRLARVSLHQADRFLLEPPERFGDQQSSESLSAVLFDDVDICQPDRS